jgi:hypothetical protein
VQAGSVLGEDSNGRTGFGVVRVEKQTGWEAGRIWNRF